MAHNTQLVLASGMVRHAILGKRRSGSNDRTRFGAYVTCDMCRWECHISFSLESERRPENLELRRAGFCFCRKQRAITVPVHSSCQSCLIYDIDHWIC